MGDRTIEVYGSMCYESTTNDNRAVLVLSTYKEEGFWNKTITGSKTSFEGFIYKVEPDSKSAE